METIYPCCRNCGKEVKENYCGHCGQSIKKGGRINSRYILEEAQHSVFHIDKGIFYTLKELLVRPGKMINNYLDGKRVDYFKPFAIVILFAGVYGFIVYFFNIIPDMALTSYMGYTDENRYIHENVTSFIYRNYSLVMFFSLPLFALSTFLVFRKSGYNYLENLVICCYITAIQILIMLLFYPLYFILPANIILSITFLLTYLYYGWVLFELFHKTNWPKTVLKIIASLVIQLFFIFIFIFTGASIYFIFQYM